jgi:hypothetical protein
MTFVSLASPSQPSYWRVEAVFGSNSCPANWTAVRQHGIKTVRGIRRGFATTSEIGLHQLHSQAILARLATAPPLMYIMKTRFFGSWPKIDPAEKPRNQDDISPILFRESMYFHDFPPIDVLARNEISPAPYRPPVWTARRERHLK